MGTVLWVLTIISIILNVLPILLESKRIAILNVIDIYGLEQESFIGNQSGGRVFLFLGTDDFWRDYNEMINVGIEFVREPKVQEYGTVAVFKDLYGNLWDLIGFNEKHPMFKRVK